MNGKRWCKIVMLLLLMMLATYSASFSSAAEQGETKTNPPQTILETSTHTKANPSSPDGDDYVIGQVLNPDGTPCNGAVVHILHRFNNGMRYCEDVTKTSTDNSGRFKIFGRFGALYTHRESSGLMESDITVVVTYPGRPNIFGTAVLDEDSRRFRTLFPDGTCDSAKPPDSSGKHATRDDPRGFQIDFVFPQAVGSLLLHVLSETPRTKRISPRLLPRSWDRVSPLLVARLTGDLSDYPRMDCPITSQSGGTYVIRNLPAGEYTVTCNEPGWLPGWLSFRGPFSSFPWTQEPLYRRLESVPVKAGMTTEVTLIPAEGNFMKTPVEVLDFEGIPIHEMLIEKSGVNFNYSKIEKMSTTDTCELVLDAIGINRFRVIYPPYPYLSHSIPVTHEHGETAWLSVGRSRIYSHTATIETRLTEQFRFGAIEIALDSTETDVSGVEVVVESDSWFTHMKDDPQKFVKYIVSKDQVAQHPCQGVRDGRIKVLKPHAAGPTLAWSTKAEQLSGITLYPPHGFRVDFNQTVSVHLKREPVAYFEAELITRPESSGHHFRCHIVARNRTNAVVLFDSTSLKILAGPFFCETAELVVYEQSDVNGKFIGSYKFPLTLKPGQFTKEHLQLLDYAHKAGDSVSLQWPVHHGVIQDHLGRGVPNATVYLFEPNRLNFWKMVGGAHSGPEGEFYLAPRGDRGWTTRREALRGHTGYTLLAFYPGFCGTVIREIHETQQTQPILKLPPPRFCRGQLHVGGMTDLSRACIVSVRAEYQHADPFIAQCNSLSTSCDDLGNFCLAGLTPGTYEVQASMDGLWLSESKMLIVPSDGPEELSAVQLEMDEPGDVVYIRFVDTSGHPISGEHVIVNHPKGPLNALYEDWVWDTDYNGKVRVEGLPAGTHEIRIEGREQCWTASIPSVFRKSSPALIQLTLSSENK